MEETPTFQVYFPYFSGNGRYFAARIIKIAYPALICGVGVFARGTPRERLHTLTATVVALNCFFRCALIVFGSFSVLKNPIFHILTDILIAHARRYVLRALRDNNE